MKDLLTYAAKVKQRNDDKGRVFKRARAKDRSRYQKYSYNGYRVWMH